MNSWKIDGEKPEKLGRVLGDDLGWSIDIDFGGKNNFCNIYRNTEKEALETANLITAAPDLLNALIQLNDVAQQLDQSATHDGLINSERIVAANAAIKKALEGGASC